MKTKVEIANIALRKIAAGTEDTFPPFGKMSAIRMSEIACGALKPEAAPVPVWDLDQDAWNRVKTAAAASNWIPKEYCMNDWLSDVCNFLTHGSK